MKITHNKVGQNLNVTDAKSEKAGAAGKAGALNKQSTTAKPELPASVGGAQAAKVELSSRAQDVKKIKELAQNTPDVDAAKVEKFKKLITEGKYKVDAKAVADRMVDEHLAGAGSASNE